MVKLFLFFKKIHVLLLFIILELVAVRWFVGRGAYEESRAISASNAVFGGVHKLVGSSENYFTLSSQNKQLIEYNAKLLAQVEDYKNKLQDVVNATRKFTLDSTIADSVVSKLNQFTYYPVNVIRDNITQVNNFITIDKGVKQGIRPDMALFNERGIVGYVVSCSDNYAVAVSVLNVKDFRSSGKLKGTDYKGSLRWSGNDYRELDFIEVAKYSDIKIGDTILTTRSSNIFPEDLPVGVVKSVEIINGTYYNAKVTLFADMAKLNHLWAVSVRGQNERKMVEANYK